MAQWIYIALPLAVFAAFCITGGAFAPESYEKQIYTRLMQNYEKSVRPVANQSETVKVYISVSLVKLNKLDEKDQVLTSSVWIRHMWRDVNLKWDPASYGQVKQLRIPIQNLWTPDIVLFNGDSKNHFDPVAVVENDGSVLWIPYTTLSSFCPLDMKRFPYDEQTCNIKFGSWAYDGHKVDLRLDSKFPAFDTRYLMKHHGWDLYESDVERNEIKYPCCEEPYPNVDITMKLKRTGGYFPYFFVAPAVLLCFLIPAMFLIPTCSQEKTTVGVGILVCTTLLATVLSDILPSDTYAVPSIGQYYLANIVLTVIALVVVFIIINIANAENKRGRVPGWARRIFLSAIGRLLFVVAGRVESPTEPPKTDGEAAEGEAINLAEKSSDSDANARSGIDNEWRRLAQVVDRLFFVIFLVICIILTIALLSS